jgi:arylformamidase
MKIHDISIEIKEDMAVYKNKKEKRPKLIVTRTFNNGANESKLEIESHTGTHADAFFHMLSNGSTIEKISVDRFIGECIVLDFTETKEKISIRDFNKIIDNYNKSNINDSRYNKNKDIIKKRDIVLLKTRNKPLNNFDPDFTYLDKTGAKFLARKKVKCVGIDNLGIERDQPGHETHKILFKKNIPIVEGLELSKIRQGRYFFVGLPLKIKSGDGSPIRAILMEK